MLLRLALWNNFLLLMATYFNVNTVNNFPPFKVKTYQFRKYTMYYLCIVVPICKLFCKKKIYILLILVE